MKKMICFLFLFFMVAGSFAEEKADNTAIGKASQESVKIAKKKEWHNWAVAGCAIIVAALAIFIVSTNQGRSAGSS